MHENYCMYCVKTKGRPFSVVDDEFVSRFELQQMYSNHIFKTARSNRMMAAILNLLMNLLILSDQEHGY